MATRSDGKLNQLLQELPEGLLVDAAWLEAKGYSSALRSHYLNSGWLDSPTRRVYRRSRGNLTWQQTVISLQSLLDLPLTVGGRTALEEQGYSHYISTVTQRVYLYGPTKPPTWLDDLRLETEFKWRNSRRLFPKDAEAPPLPTPVMYSASGMQLPIRYSSKERAALELLDELPKHESFHQVDMLFEGMSTLSPRKLQPLLEHCFSVKVKRLFLFFADRHNHAWRSHLDVSKIDLGSGKRALVAGGKLDTRYGITLPAELFE